jgi:hypothetical protein
MFLQLWAWLLNGLGPYPYVTLFAVLVITLICGIIVAFLATYMGTVRWTEWLYYVVVAPVVEELICHQLLVGWLMTFYWPCAAPQTTVLCGVTFGLMHLPGGLLRLLDGLILGFFNTIACLVYVRCFFQTMQDETIARWIVSLLALIVAHAVYNLLTLLVRSMPIMAVVLRIMGIVLCIGAWGAWMPRLT